MRKFSIVLLATLLLLSFSSKAQLCPNPHDSNSDGAVTINDLLDLLGVFGDIDIDSDGIWDSVDYCTDLSACNYSTVPTETCSYIDILGICGGGCLSDFDSDGICDTEDGCVGVVDECGVCNGTGPSELIIESITILYDSVYVPDIDFWFVYDNGSDTVFSFICDNFQSCGDSYLYNDFSYSTVLIGEQCWFSENLHVESYRNGDAIQHLPINNDWSSTTQSTTGAWSIYENDQTLEGALGKLYNWYAVNDSRNLCPSGWHVPSYNEWSQLTAFLGGDEIAGHHLKDNLEWNGSNSSGFSMLPCGLRLNNGAFDFIDGYGYCWSSSPAAGSGAHSVGFDYSQTSVFRFEGHRRNGFSVRCVSDLDLFVISGCIDENACNYNINATQDDGSCLVNDQCGVCGGDGSTCYIPCGESVPHMGYDYATVQIGSQCWFSENCRYLPSVSPSSVGSETIPHYYVYSYEGSDITDANTLENYNTYGVLYNFSAISMPGVCPSGWHVPSDIDWQNLELELGMSESVLNNTGWRGTDQGSQIKSNSGWSVGGNGSNTSGFSALPGGYRYSGGFIFASEFGYWWTSTPLNSTNSLKRVLSFEKENISRDNSYRDLGYSTRCVQD
jgi:uncharacterized protein (TIGR02145 family)